MTKEQFTELFIKASTEVADKFYPKNEFRTTGVEIDMDVNDEPIKTERSRHRGEYIRDQALLHYLLAEELKEAGVLES